MQESKDPNIRKMEIMDAATSLFQNQGYLKTTTQDIIDKVGISRGLLYYYFKSKEDILFYLVERNTEPLIQKIEKLIYEENITALEKIRKFIKYTKISETEITEEKKSIQESVSLDENRYMIDHIGHKISNSLTECFAHIIEQGNEEKVFDVARPKETANFLMTGYTFVSLDINQSCNDIESLKSYLFAFEEILQLTLKTKEILFNE